MSYKLHINSYLTAVRKKQLDVVASQKTQAQPATEAKQEQPTQEQATVQPAAETQTQ